MACDLIGNMERIGFTLETTGGNCRAMVQTINGRQIVATSKDGDLPFDDDFLVCVYEGDWLANCEAPELLSITIADTGEQPASGLEPIDEALQMALYKAHGLRWGRDDKRIAEIRANREANPYHPYNVMKLVFARHIAAGGAIITEQKD